jgi:serine/threonine protein kinase
MVRIENLAPDLNVVVAVWIADPLLPRLKQGTKVGHDRFTLSRPLGAGGMGVVWMAFDEQLNEFVALKFLPPQVRNDPGALEDLRVETLKSRQLSHPHIIRIHDLHLSKDEPPFISMEYVDGATLHEVRLRQPHGVLSWPHLEPWITQLCQALDYAHREKVVHLDLKPSNLMIDDKGRLKLADFGLATAVADAASQTTPSLVKGTLGYMSPQQLQGKRGQVSDDIYALGATLYTLMTSHAPFHTGNVVEQVLNATPLTMAEKLAELGVQADIPAPVSEVVMLCLERDPSRRPRSALAVTKTIVQNMANQPPAANGENLAPGAPRGPGGWLRNLLK